MHNIDTNCPTFSVDTKKQVEFRLKIAILLDLLLEIESYFTKVLEKIFSLFSFQNFFNLEECLIHISLAHVLTQESLKHFYSIIRQKNLNTSGPPFLKETRNISVLLVFAFSHLL